MQSIMDYSNIRQPGRFIFRIDEWIQPGGCNDIDSDLNFELDSIIWTYFLSF